MIVAIKDLNGSRRITNEITAAIAGYTSRSGANVLVLQFDAEEQGSVDNILFKTEAYADGYYTETGIDALLSEAALNTVTKEAFEANVRTFTKGRKLDVAEVSKQEMFTSSLEDKEAEVKALLISAKSVYDYVFVVLGNGTEKSLFKSYADDIAAMYDTVVWIGRQGSKCEEHEHFKNEIYLLTGYNVESKYTFRVMAKRFGAGNAPILPYATTAEYRDAVDDEKLLVFLRKAKSEENDVCADSVSWSMQVRAIMEALGASKLKPVEIWNLAEFDEHFDELGEATDVENKE